QQLGPQPGPNRFVELAGKLLQVRIAGGRGRPGAAGAAAAAASRCTAGADDDAHGAAAGAPSGARKISDPSPALVAIPAPISWDAVASMEVASRPCVAPAAGADWTRGARGISLNDVLSIPRASASRCWPPVEASGGSAEPRRRC